jgi:putative transposase
MPRKARGKSESGLYHIMLRGTNRQSIFEDDEDKEKFLQTLKECKEISKYKIFAYCLMNNHVHLLLKVEEEPLELIFKRIGVRYVFWYNAKYERCGHLFQDRYKSEPIEDDRYFLTVLRYILQNPIKAGLCQNLDRYKWSSYNDYSNYDGITDIKFALEMFTQGKEKQVELFKKYINGENDDRCLEIEEIKKKITDEELKIEIKKKYQVEPMMIQNLSNDEQIRMVKWIKEIDGVSLRQISRITGFTVNRIFKY